MMVFLKQLTGLCLFRLALDFILPEGEMSRYAAFGMELCFMLCMIGGAARVLRGS